MATAKRLRLVDHQTVKSEAHTSQRRARDREHLTDGEMAQLLKAAREGRHGVRDELMVLLGWRHGLRAEELISLRLTQINIPAREIYVTRVKGSEPSHHPLQEDEVRLLKRWLKIREANKGAASERLFLNERGEGLTRFALNYLLKEIGQRAGFPFRVYPHMLRHSCGHHLASRGGNAFTIAAYLGHVNIQNTKRYTHQSSERFKGLW